MLFLSVKAGSLMFSSAILGWTEHLLPCCMLKCGLKTVVDITSLEVVDSVEMTCS